MYYLCANKSNNNFVNHYTTATAMTIITRKIQVYVAEEDKALRKEFIHTMYAYRDLVRQAANIIVSHKFVQENLKNFVYVKDEVKEKFYVKDILKEGKGMSEQNTTYRVLTEFLKGRLPSGIRTALNQEVVRTFQKTKKDMNSGKASLRSYKNNIPIPFTSQVLKNIRWSEEDKRFYFTLFGIPFGTALGRDRSNNRQIIERAISQEYKLCSSSIVVDDDRKKMFLHLCVDMPSKKVELKEDAVLYAMLSADVPVQYFTGDTDDAAAIPDGDNVYSIGTKEDFLYKKQQIQAALRRAQVAVRYNRGGKGRKRKLQSLDKFHDKESNYVKTKLHLYSRLLVNEAVKARASKIVLLNGETSNEEKDAFLLRSWSYCELMEKIKYKAALFGIAVESKKI
jgi:transposase